MRIVLAGGSGLLGSMLQAHLVQAGHEVVVLSRKATEIVNRTSEEGDSGTTRANRETMVRIVPWDAKTLGPWFSEIDGADVVINLAGRSVNCRYNETNRREILQSRTDSTRMIGQAIQRASRPPKAWLQASSATIYRHEFDQGNDEFSGIIDDGQYRDPSWRFSIDVVKAWEAACLEAETPATRKALLRISLIMSPDRNSVFDLMLNLVRKGLGGTLGNGRQYVSWMHYLDFLHAVDLVIDRPISGPVNMAAPNPLPNRDFMKILRQVSGVPLGLPAFQWMLEIGAIFMQTETELILKSRRVVPGVLLDSGFQFQFANWQQAAEDLYRRWKVNQKF